MAQGRGSAARGNGGTAVVALVLLCVLLHGEVAESAVYTVGDSSGWGFNTVGWPSGKRFRAGDVLGQCQLTVSFPSRVAASAPNPFAEITNGACMRVQCSGTARRRTTWWP
jgi:hypothetical protein